MSGTTQEFALRLILALDTSPHAPAAQYGRLTWLQRELETHAGVKVSVNTVHKWYHGAARPRPDNIRHIAQLLKVDEVWLALGRKPTEAAEPTEITESRATGAVLMVAGLLEQVGGRVTFPANGGSQAHLHVNLGRDKFDLIVVTPQAAGGEISFIIPQPVKKARIVAAMMTPGANGHSFILDLLDITDSPRQDFGGFSVAQFDRDPDETVRNRSNKSVIRPLLSVQDLVRPNLA